MAWLPDASPSVYDCRASGTQFGTAGQVWRRVCSVAASKHEPRLPARSLSWRGSPLPNATPSAPPNATRLFELIGNRTVWVLGDSHGLDLFCALSCYFMHAAPPSLRPLATFEQECTGTSDDPQSADCKRQHVLVARGPPPLQARFRVPTCATAKGGKCGVGTHCGTLGREPCKLGCGSQIVSQLQRLPRPVVVLYSPCPTYMRGDMMETILSLSELLVRAESTRRVHQARADSLPFMGKASSSAGKASLLLGKGHSSNSSMNELLRFARLDEHPLKALCAMRRREKQDREGGACRTFRDAAVTPYVATAAATAALLRRVREASGNRSSVVLVQSPVQHFPALLGLSYTGEIQPLLDPWTEERLDGPGSYERLVASSLLWLYTTLQGAGREDGGGGGGGAGGSVGGAFGTPLTGSAAGDAHFDEALINRLSTALGVRMAAPTSFRGEPDHFEPSMALGISQRLQATRAAAKGVGGGVATTPSWPLLPSSRLQLASYLNATLALLESSSDPQAALAELRAFKCAEYSARDEAARVVAARDEATRDEAARVASGWRQQIEAAPALRRRHRPAAEN